MASNDNANRNPPPPIGGNAPPIKPWERAPPSTTGPTPFRPSSAGGTSDVVEASGTAKPGEIVSAVTPNTSTVVPRPPPRPWEQQNTYGNSYGSMYNSGMTGYGSGMYGGSYGGLYGNNMYRGGMYGGAYGGGGGGGSSMYGGGMYGNNMYGGGMYGGGAYGGSMYGGMGGYGGAGMSGPYGGNNQDPNSPYGSPAKPPGFWISLLRVLEGVVNFFGRISILIDQNTHALSNFMMAMLQLCDRSGILYGELARFVLRLLGIKSKPRRQVGPPGQLPGPDGQVKPQVIEGPKAPSGWDNAWDADASKPNLSG